MKDVIISSHVISGTLVLGLGLLIVSIAKGSKTHVRLGWAYVFAMSWVCLSAFTSLIFINFSLFLMVIGILTFNSTFQELRVIRRASSFRAKWFDFLVSSLVLFSGIGLFTYAIYLLVNHPTQYVLAGLSTVFGVFVGIGAFKDLRFYLGTKPQDQHWWLYQHIGSMGGSYIAAITAFAVQNGNLFSISGSMYWLPWVLPGIIGSIILNRVIGKYRTKKYS